MAAGGVGVSKEVWRKVCNYRGRWVAIIDPSGLRAVLTGRVQKKWHSAAVMGPPGHHARPAAPQPGSCMLFNNVAIAARHAAPEAAWRRSVLAIVDWKTIHHGNGTGGDLLFRTISVLFSRDHQWPLRIAGDRALRETGQGAAAGLTINCHFRRARHEEVLDAYSRAYSGPEELPSSTAPDLGGFWILARAIRWGSFGLQTKILPTLHESFWILRRIPAAARCCRFWKEVITLRGSARRSNLMFHS